MKRATDAISLGWDAVRERLRPGIRYSDMRRIGSEALKKAGYDVDVAFTPHSVGLVRTDEPGARGAGGQWVKDDIVLQPGMILSVDFPVRRSGIGGSAHLENLTLIKRDGGVPINDLGNRTILI
jgi:Xaa-Pro aminopeptidase